MNTLKLEGYGKQGGENLPKKKNAYLYPFKHKN